MPNSAVMKYFNKAALNKKTVFFKKSINPVRSAYNLFIVLMQTLNVDKDSLVRFIGKALSLPKHENIILNSMMQTREKWDSLF